MIKTIKGITIGLSAALLLTACSTKQEPQVAPVKAEVEAPAKAVKQNIASDATAAEVKAHDEYVAKAKEKKRRKKVRLKKEKIDLDKFCFKDNHSIHYRAQERCK
jgi:uncharacterized protein YcfL